MVEVSKRNICEQLKRIASPALRLRNLLSLPYLVSAHLLSCIESPSATVAGDRNVLCT